MKKCLFIAISVATLFFSCKKEELDLPIQEISTGTSQTIYDIDFASENVGFAVGGTQYESSIILKTIDGGSTWTLDESVASQGFYGVDLIDENIGFVTGYGGKILKTLDGGDYWDVFQDNSYGAFYDVSAISSDNIVVVGGEDTGYVMTSLGDWWIHERLPQDNSVKRTVFLSENIGYITGNGFVKKTTDRGQTWQQASPKNDNFVSIDFPSTTVGYVCGFQGSIWKTEDAGNSWRELEKNNKIFTKRVHFRAIDFFDEENGLVVGLDGAVYLTHDGGEQWQKIKTNTSTDFYAVKFVEQSVAVFSGKNGNVYKILL